MDKMKDKNCDYKKMFGYPAYFFNGNMFLAVHGDKLFLRLSEADTAEIKKDRPSVTAFEPMPGKAMKSYMSSCQNPSTQTTRLSPNGLTNQ